MNKYTQWALLGLAALPANAFFLMPCWPVSTQRIDPIVEPGSVSSHVHQIAGGSGFAPMMNYSDTQSASCTTCFVKGDKSNYWIPAMYVKRTDGSFERVPQVGSASMYYFNEPSRLGPGEKFEPFPKGLRMLAGDPSKRSAGTDAASQAVNYKCLDYSGVPTDSKTFPSKNCPNGIRAEVTYPSCWDGKNLDSTDHKSHMAYPTGNFENGACPSTHPHHVVVLKVEFIFDTAKYQDQWVGGQQPFVWANGDPNGYSLHADYFMGWDYDLLSAAVAQCFDEFGVLANCKPFAGQIQSAYVNPGTCKVDSFVSEDVGGTIKAMPGCNSIQAGPGSVQKAVCNDNIKLVANWAKPDQGGFVNSLVNNLLPSASSTSSGKPIDSDSTSAAPLSASPQAFYSQDNYVSGTSSQDPSSSSEKVAATTVQQSNPSNPTDRPVNGVKIVTVTDIVTEIVYTTVNAAAPTPTPTNPWINLRREIGDNAHMHHYHRHLRGRRITQHGH